MTVRRNAYSMLRSLPRVFDLAAAEALLGLSRKHAAQYAWRWKEAGLVRPVGPKAGAYYNLVAEPDPSNAVRDAVELVLRRPSVLAGATALHWHGWTTQRPRRHEIAVAVDRDTPGFAEIDMVTLSPRPVSWFARVMPSASAGPDGFQAVSPGHAIADCFIAAARFEGLPPERRERERGRMFWRPDPDDLDPEGDPEEAYAQAISAGQELGADMEAFAAYLSEIDAFSGLAPVPAAGRAG